MNVLLHTDVFFHKIFELDIHFKWDRAFKQSWEFLHIKTAKIDVIHLFSKSLVACSKIEIFFFEVFLHIFAEFRNCHRMLFRTVSIL